MLGSWIWPLAATLLTAAFTVLLWRQYAARKKIHQLAWTIGFGMWAVASAMEFSAIMLEVWPSWLYRLYIVTTASLVPVLGYGTIRLIAHRPIWGRLYVALNAALIGVFTFGVFTHGLDVAELANANVASYAALGPKGTFPRGLSAFIAIPAALVLFYGAVHSVFMFLRRKEFTYRAWANVSIAAATFIIAFAGSLAAAGKPEMFFVAELAAAILYAAGFLIAGTLKLGAKEARKNRESAQDRSAR